MKFNLKKVLTNIYVRNILLMVIVAVILVLAALFWLNIYTRHNQSITVPSLKGLQVDEVEAIVKAASLNYEVVDSIYEKISVPGSVIEQIPRENSKVKEGRTIYLIVQAKAEPLVAIPELTDISQRQAETLLNALGFTNIQIEEVASEYRGLVVSVEYKGVPLTVGQKIPKGSPLRMKVGDGGDYTDSLSEETLQPEGAVDIDDLFH